MNIRHYSHTDHIACMEIIKSNTPDFFTEDEVALFEEWLFAQEEGKLAHPVSEEEFYFVLEESNRVVGCAGYLLVKNSSKIYLSWGMVHKKLQKLGYGKKLLEYRFDSISQSFPKRTIALATTQNIAPFFEKYGFKTVEIKPNYYSESLDRYDMKK